MSRKFKLMKSFQPCPVEADDELYPNGIFEFNVTKLLSFMATNPEKFPVEQVEVADLPDYDTGDRLDQKTIQTANLSNPIILAEIRPGHFNVIDGHHRLERARRDELEKIPARRISADQHYAFLTSVRAYEAYVRYWNEKIEDGV